MLATVVLVFLEWYVYNSENMHPWGHVYIYYMCLCANQPRDDWIDNFGTRTAFEHIWFE